MARRTILVLGDQLNRSTGALAEAGPEDACVRMVVSRAKLRQRPWHRAKLHLMLSAMRRFAASLQEEGFEVSLREADTFLDGLSAATDPVAMAPSSWDARQRFADAGVEMVANDAFIVGEEGFAEWADGRKTLGLEWFYREVRKSTGWLMDDRGEPAGGEWNHDRDNRERPPRDGVVDAPPPWRPAEDEVDTEVRAWVEGLEGELGLELYGSMDRRLFPTSRSEALCALDDFVASRLDGFGPLEDAVVDDEPFLWHSLLSVPLNYGLLHPREVCEAVDRAWRGGGLRLNSVEGFLRQVAGWREYVWGIYWHRMPDWREDNHLGQTGAVPQAFWDADTDMACVRGTVEDLLQRGWTHHIPRLMILGNFALLAGVNPQALTDWFHSMYVDALDWVMVPNVIGMSQWADGGVMATKPYASSARYLDRMTTYCDDCAFDKHARTGEDACPFNALYWDFLSRHRTTLRTNRRMAPILSTLDRFDRSERDAIRERARSFRTDYEG